MGRKRRVPARVRENVAAEEAAEAMEVEQREAVLSAKPDGELFIVDAVGSKRRRRKLEKDAKQQKYVSKAEMNLVARKYLGRARSGQATRPKSVRPTRLSDPWAVHDDSDATPNVSLQHDEQGSAGALTVARRSSSDSHSPQTLSLTSSTPTTAVGGECRDADLDTIGKPVSEMVLTPNEVRVSRVGGLIGEEEEDDFLQISAKPGRPLKRPKPSSKNLAKLGVCHPGQSYNPTTEDHDDVLASAVAVELRRQKAVDDEAKPVSAGMSRETLDLLVGDERDAEESSDEERGGDKGGSLGRPTPATGKLTRAQRNKQKRAKAAEDDVLRRQKKKSMMKTIDQISVLQQEVAEQERLRNERRQTKRLLKAQTTRLKEGAEGDSIFGPSAGVVTESSNPRSNKDFIESRSVPVNLSEELHGSLRQLRTQGSVLLDKVELLKANKSHPDRRRGKERAKKASKGFRKKYIIKDRYKNDP